ncbi:MAG: AI-2E family transporter [Acidimicrobiales bacterium]|nr:AI-2E family transporter [Acidimicrobiales bacterium]MDG1877413.1 AI-2E family transporter [Acidimicrobiales bacterium]
MEPENPPESQQSASESSGSKVPRWVIKAITLFWVGWAVSYVGTGMVRNLRSLMVVMLISLFLSFAIEPAVNRLESWGFRRGLGVWVVYLGLFVAIASFSAAIGTALATQVNSLVEEAPRYVEDIEVWLQENVDEDIDLQRISDEFVEGGGASDLANRFANDVVSLGTTVLNVLFQTFTVLLFTFYLVAEGPQLRRNVCSFLQPHRQRTVLAVWDLAIEKTGGYIYSRGILAVLSATAHFIAFEFLDVPFPVPLAIWVGVMSQFIPVIGTYFAGALPLIITVVDSPRTALSVLIVVIAYQQLENYLFAPRVTAQTMEIHVAVAYGSVIAGGALLGVVGALLALPFAATAQAFVSGYRQHFDVEEDTLAASAKRRGRRQRPEPE